VILPAFTGPEIHLLEEKISDVVDAAIVNEKQGKAIKKLIAKEFREFIDEHWEPIRGCSFVKEYIDGLVDKEM
jgi:hypothetical protein